MHIDRHSIADAVLILTRLPHKEWHTDVTELKRVLDASPGDLSLAVAYWDAISGSLGYDVRDCKKAIDTFRACAFTSDDGLAQLMKAIRKLSDDFGEVPRESLFDPPLENLLRIVARNPVHSLSDDAAWILGFFDMNDS